MAIKTIDELTSMDTSELTSSDVLIVGTSSGAKKISAQAAFSGGGGSSAPDIYVSSTADDNPGIGGETYTSPVFGFGDTIDNIVDKLEDGSFVFSGKLAFPGTMGTNYVDIACNGISAIPKATLEGYSIATLSDAIAIEPVVIGSWNSSNSVYTISPSGWDNSFIYYTDGDEESQTYGEIVPLVIGG